ncbi:fumarylacetoacetate hydrolase family protein [Yinghuangia seranimata]|uniref:fumarylacetoacetate hydrolase family protein n=1 Tax=Yinghuangia seranimata TaxID=408067 RepID=UPI00248ABAC7|nr:fumarylacetoacetate hydrolase family protein [Yinghuangia seranimata]MDI2124748.1 fumarylacetoacetate hydrolase family protein [Yinghuangia seranimata]
MRIANVAGRATLLDADGGGLDVEKASGGRFPSDPQALFESWDALRDWAAGAGGGDFAVDESQLRAPTPLPRQVFAIGLNYAEHAAEAQLERPESPPVFTKFPTSVTGPRSPVVLPSGNVDWEVELVVAIGRTAVGVAESAAWGHVAGLMVGQDLSERVVQLSGPAPQFSLGKSFPGFAPLGPALVTPDEVADPDDLELGCAVDGEVLQHGRTRDMIFGVAELVARLSAVCPLLPGDIIFTGTPSGVGMARDPQRYLRPGTTLVSHIAGIGELRNDLVDGPGARAGG